MNFNNLEEIEKEGFTGFKKMSDLFADPFIIPKSKGVYLVLRLNKSAPTFLTVGTGGHFKGKNPNVAIETLQSNWVDKTIVVYIGKAGSTESKATLFKRLKQYLRFGQGVAIGHFGGRMIWQLGDSKDLVLCWKTTPMDDPQTYESALIQEFKTQFSKRPFANLKD